MDCQNLYCNNTPRVVLACQRLVSVNCIMHSSNHSHCPIANQIADTVTMEAVSVWLAST